MRSKTSSFNHTAFRKDLTRFAPVWVLYTICLILGLFLLYTDRTNFRDYYFAHNMTQLLPVMGVVNLFYAPLVAQLVFGDLYNSRMCNMLHAMPLRRESWFAAHVASGVLFSLIPTAIMLAVATPLLMGSIFEGGWKIGVLVFLGTNLQYLCFFGIAVFAVMCVGNRFTMAAGYGLINAGAYIGYWLIDTIYTPMLYGIVTPTTLAENLTPVNHMTSYTYIDADNRSLLREKFGEELKGAVAQFQLTEEWWRLWVCAAVGIVFLLAALWLYRKRHLECAGDAVAFSWMKPVFQVLCSVFVMTAAQFFLYSFLGLRDGNYVVLAVGLCVGWFIGKMLIERSTRVFRLQNWYGLGALAAALVLTLVCTHFDVLNIEERMPKFERIKSVAITTNYTGTLATENTPEDIQLALRLHEYALEDRADSTGGYVIGSNGEWVSYVDTNSDLIDEEDEDQPWRYVARVELSYELTNGNYVRREYNVWVDSPAGELTREYLNRWDVINSRYVTIDEVQHNRLDVVLDTFKSMYVGYIDEEDMPEELQNRETAESFIAAVMADAAEGNLAQHPYFHTGYFVREDERYEDGLHKFHQLYINLEGERYSWEVEIFPDSRHTVKWLQDHGLMEGMEIREGDFGYR